MTSVTRGLYCGFLLASLLGCKVIDKLKQRAEGATADEGAKGTGSAAPSGAASGATAAPRANTNDKVVTMTSKFSPLPIRVGQMVNYRSGNDQNSGFSYSVIGKEQGAYRIEVVSPSKAGKTVTQILLKVNDARDPESIKLLSASVKAPGMPAITFDEKQSDLLGKVSQGIIQAVKVPDYQGAPREDVVVPAGTFKGAIKVHQKEKMFGFDAETTSWHHSSVPVTTLVKMEGTFQGKPTHLELIDYSMQGAMKEP